MFRNTYFKTLGGQRRNTKYERALLRTLYLFQGGITHISTGRMKFDQIVDLPPFHNSTERTLQQTRQGKAAGRTQAGQAERRRHDRRTFVVVTRSQNQNVHTHPHAPSTSPRHQPVTTPRPHPAIDATSPRAPCGAEALTRRRQRDV